LNLSRLHPLTRWINQRHVWDANDGETVADVSRYQHNVIGVAIRSGGTATPSRVAPRGPLGTARSRLLRVLELGSRLQRVLGRAGQDDLAHLLLELGHRNRDVMLAHAEEPANSDDRVRDRPVGRHDQVVNVADLFAGIIVDVLPEDLLFRAPSLGNLSQLFGRDRITCRSRSVNLGALGRPFGLPD
jgi:hypothetical protein